MKDKLKDKLKSLVRKADSIFALMKIGSGWKLFYFDVFILAFILFDGWAIYNLNLDMSHFSFFRRIWEAINPYYLTIAVLIIYLPPIISALVDFLFRDAESFKEKTIPLRFRSLLLIFHFFISIVFVFVMSISHELQVLSGFKTGFGSPAILSYDYRPLYSWISLWAVTIGSILVVVAKPILSALANRKDVGTEFNLWFKLSDTASEYFPKQRESLIFVNTASMAPSINWIITREESYRHSYQKRVPTSDDAKEYLRAAAEKCRDGLRGYLFQDTAARAPQFSIEFLPGTSRGLEVGLNQIDKLDTIIVSPYEHPSQDKVVEWFAALNPSIKHTRLKMEYSILKRGWSEQKSWLLGQIRSAIPVEANRKVAILLSEVHYLTGMVINVDEIIKTLRVDYSNLVFMVDGSQAAGNLLKPFNRLADNLHREDFYYFSAHKWLLSPNTCGVLIAEQNPSRYKVYPYDLFGAELPSATIDPGVIFGIRSSLKFLIGNKMFHLKKFHEKSNHLKSYFMKNIGEQFEVIESASHEMNQSNFIAVRPRSGNRWKEETRQEFWNQITKDGVDLTVVPLDGAEANTWWLRISFPYFLQLHLLKQLIKHLKARVTSIN
ncbi:MAG: cysteine desulfurase / selenocysteine lyase [Pyrinomonadaceae bacterium]|jgi:hypothetical protein|nr:cysteine desulfurase / selenocysteine lyase [Pyrinomonadaceae bacterium]